MASDRGELMKLRYMLPRRIEGGEKEERCPESFSFIDPALATGFGIILVSAGTPKGESQFQRHRKGVIRGRA